MSVMGGHGTLDSWLFLVQRAEHKRAEEDIGRFSTVFLPAKTEEAFFRVFCCRRDDDYHPFSNIQHVSHLLASYQSRHYITLSTTTGTEVRHPCEP
jgi:hypothetical protein